MITPSHPSQNVGAFPQKLENRIEPFWCFLSCLILLPPGLVVTESKNLCDDFWQEVGWGSRSSVLVNPKLWWNKRWGVLQRLAVWFKCCASMHVCVCTVYMFPCMKCLMDREQNTANRNEQKKYIRCYFIRRCTCSPWWEATVSQLCNLPVSLPSLLHLRFQTVFHIPHRFFLCPRTTISNPWFKVSMLQWFFS